MAIHSGVNASWAYPVFDPPVDNGDTIQNCNLSQLEPHTDILKVYTGLTYSHCNLVNCDVSNDAIIEDCNNAHIDFCTHLNEGLIDFGLTPCLTECEHLILTEEILVDGELIDTLYEYENFVVA